MAMSDMVLRSPGTISALLSSVESLISGMDRAEPPASQPREHQTAEQPLEPTRLGILGAQAVDVATISDHAKAAGFGEVAAIPDPRDALALVCGQGLDVLLVDIANLGTDGLNLLRQIRAEPAFAEFPVIVLTATGDGQRRTEALELGATDFLSTPVDPIELTVRLRNALSLRRCRDRVSAQARELERHVRERTEELAASRLEVIHCLARAAEFRDNETGMHVVRVGHYAAIIAQQLGLHKAAAERIAHAAPLHDLGKIGIPDAILLKPGKLDPDEFEVMKRHCEFGFWIVEETSLGRRRASLSEALRGPGRAGASRSPLLRTAGIIALTHHEKWDGSGYPLGLAGDEIPLEGRITAVADVFDALSSKRPYKRAFPIETCLAMLQQGRGTHFDPQVLDAFLARENDARTIFHVFADPAHPVTNQTCALTASTVLAQQEFPQTL